MDVRIARAVHLIEREMTEPSCFDGVAAAIGLSPSRFHHLFREVIGVPPGAYLRRVRLDAAALRLRWTDESAARIGLALGYDSHAAFTRAFQRRFHATPGRFRALYARSGRSDSEKRRVAVRDVGGFRLLARRYVGDPWRVRDYWADFEDRLPGGFARWRAALFLGLVYDDPATTSLGEIRYDCCVTLPEDVGGDGWEAFAASGLHRAATRAGRYASLSFTGHRDAVLPAYRFLCDCWAPASRYTITDAPLIEVQAMPRHRMAPDALDLTLLLGLE